MVDHPQGGHKPWRRLQEFVGCKQRKTDDDDRNDDDGDDAKLFYQFTVTFQVLK